MRSFRTLALAGLVVTGLAGSLPVKAQDAAAPDALAAANELFSVMSTDMVEQMVQQGLTQIWPPMEQALRGKNPNIDAAALGGLRDDIARIYRTSVSNALRDAPGIYARYFTAQESCATSWRSTRHRPGVKALGHHAEDHGRDHENAGGAGAGDLAQLNTAIVGAVEKRGLKL